MKGLIIQLSILLYLGTTGQGGDSPQNYVLIILQSGKPFIKLVIEALSKC